MKESKILIVDDHRIIADGIRAMLEGKEGIEVAGEAGNGKEAVDFLRLLPVDIVLMDIDMPVMNGMEATKRIKEVYPGVRVIILSMHAEGGLIKSLLAAGADGYILKNSDQEELVEAIRKIASGQPYYSPAVTQVLAGNPANPMGKFGTGAPVVDLTEREAEILTLIAQGLSNREIGEKLFISHRTVDTHRTNLMKKVGVKNVAGLVRYAVQHGFTS